MQKMNWKVYGFWIGLSEAVGLVSGLLTMEGSQRFGQQAAQPPLSPPGILFPIVWTVLYALMGFGAAQVYKSEPSRQRSLGINLFIVQLVVNFFWSLLFFNASAYGFAVLWLILLLALVVVMSWNFYRVDKAAGLAQIPYLLWLAFALYLSIGVWYLNRIG